MMTSKRYYKYESFVLIPGVLCNRVMERKLYFFLAALGLHNKINLPVDEPPLVRALITTIVCVKAGLDHLFQG